MAESENAVTLRQVLVDGLKEQGAIRTPEVETAFRAVPRHLFIPDVSLEEAYSDRAIATKRLNGEWISSASQPAIMAIVLEQLGLRLGQRVLQIGAGTGYNAALIAYLVGEEGKVFTVDIDEDLVWRARGHLAVGGYSRVEVICADGAYGHPDGAPYDGIILAVAAPDISPAWCEQL